MSTLYNHVRKDISYWNLWCKWCWKGKFDEERLITYGSTLYVKSLYIFLHFQLSLNFVGN